MKDNLLKNCETFPVKPCNIYKKWVLIDANNQYLGRLASIVSQILRGKNKIYFTSFLDCGDNVIVINVDKILLSGKKLYRKRYLRHTGYPGGQRLVSPEELFSKNPCKIFLHAVRGMLPKNKLGRKLLTNIRVFVGSKHNMDSVTPEIKNFNV